MKYKVGDKFILEIEAVRKGLNPYLYKRGVDCEEYFVCEQFLDNLQPLEEAEQAMTAEEAWETAKKILFKEELFRPVLEEIFGTRNHFAIMRDFTPQEAKVKIEAWEKTKYEIKVGDVLQNKRTKNKCVVTNTEILSGGALVMWYDGDFGDYDKEEIVEGFEKTGKHINIEPMLAMIGE